MIFNSFLSFWLEIKTIANSFRVSEWFVIFKATLALVWSSHYNVHSEIPERIQKKFSRHVGFRNSLYRLDSNYFSNTLLLFFVSDFQLRKNHKDLKFICKCKNGLIEWLPLLEAIDFRIPTRHITNSFIYAKSYK